MAALRESCPTILYHACEGLHCRYKGYAGALARRGMAVSGSVAAIGYLYFPEGLARLVLAMSSAGIG